MENLAAAMGAQGDPSDVFTPLAPRKPREPTEKSIFDLPDEPLKEGEKVAQAVAEALSWLEQEGVDGRCDALTLGSVADVFPRFGAALADRSVALGQVRGIWAVPPFVMADLGTDHGVPHICLVCVSRRFRLREVLGIRWPLPACFPVALIPQHAHTPTGA